MTSKPTRTFIDSSVLIAAWRGNLNLRMKALTVLSDPQREFISSPFVRLEVRPKAVFHKNQTETAFYDAFFTSVREWIDPYKKLIVEAESVGEKFGLNGMDALHIAAALLSQADEFITAERPTSPFSRVQGLSVISIA
jgi:predicted nucleic acid-binding protein